LISTRKDIAQREEEETNQEVDDPYMLSLDPEHTVTTENLQLRDRATEDSAETAWLLRSGRLDQKSGAMRTFGGETSGIITNGRGPNPMAKDMMKEMMVTVESVTQPEFKP